MAFLTRSVCALVCSLLTLLMFLTIVDYYLPPVSMNLLMKLLQVLLTSIAILGVLAGTIAFWVWVWFKNA